VSNIAGLPPAVLKAVKNWDAHLSFVFLSDEFLKLPTAKLTSYTHGVLYHPLIDTMTSEDRLDVKTWERCARRYLNLLQKFFPDRASLWEDYYNEFYFGGKISDARWQTRLEYDILHRSNTLPSSDDAPDDTIDELWVLAEEAANDKARADARLEAAEDAKKLIAMSSSARPWSERKQGNQQNASDSRHSGEAGFPSGPGGSKSKSAAQKTNPKAAQFCFACGGRSHWSSSCKATSQVNGKDMLVARDNSRVWCLVGGARFCFNFNSSLGCNNSPCADRAHVCTLCQSAEHGAFFCKA
jgi:hypothetical protein